MEHQCPICLQNISYFDFISSNVYGCQQCIAIYHLHCLAKIKNSKSNQQSRCPCCKSEKDLYSLSHLQKQYFKNQMKLYNCKLCGSLGQQGHLYDCLAGINIGMHREQIRKKQERANRNIVKCKKINPIQQQKRLSSLDKVQQIKSIQKLENQF